MRAADLYLWTPCITLMKSLCIQFGFLLIASLKASGQFMDVTAEHDIHSLNAGNLYGNGVSFYDFNHDGWDDLSMASGALEPQFFINNQGQFEPVSFGLLNTDGKQMHAIQWVDWDNDGDSDLFITRLNAVPRLMRNDGDLTFTDITLNSGINQGVYIYLGAAWTDYDKDGNLDFYLSKYYNPNNFPGNDFISRMYKGNGDGTFVDVTQSSGVFLAPRPCFQPVWFDYNGDGWDDLYLIIDRSSWRNEMFRNNGDGTFTNVTDETGTGVYIDAMTGTIGDYDNDLDFDIYVTNGYAGNKLFRNDANGTFAEIAEELGLEVGAICWGANWIDYDNNTWQDLYVSATGSFYGPYQNQFFINDQNGGFYDGIEEVGLLGDISPSMATTMGDINNDGYYDYFNANNAPYEADLWQNLGGANHWIGVELEGTFSNRDAFGTILKLHANGHAYMRCAHGGENFLGQNSGKEIFGLGETTMADSLEIFWPLGMREVYYNIAADQYLDLVEGESPNTPPVIPLETSVYCDVEDVLITSDTWSVISWNNGVQNDSLWVNDPGSFVALVMDNKGHLFYTEPVVVEEYLAPVFSVIATNPLCFGDPGGSISLNWENDAEIALITWNEGSFYGDTIQNMEEGHYEAIIQYAANCEAYASVDIVVPAALVAEPETTAVTCNGLQDGAVQVEISGGTADYVIHWNGLDPNALGADTYTVEVTDANNCATICGFTIAEPDPLQAAVEVSDVTCFGGNDGSVAISSIAGGTPGYVLNWNGADTASLSAGNFDLILFDDHGCSMTVAYTINQPAALDMSFSLEHEIEEGTLGSIDILVTGGTEPYAIYLNGTEASTLNEGLVAGQYEVALIDAHGCSLLDTVQIDFLTGLLDSEMQSVFVYPNPATDWLMIQDLNKAQRIAICDITGKEIIQEQFIPGKRIAIDRLASGWYIIRLEDEIHPLIFMKN